MNRQCRIARCTRKASPGYRICHMHRKRIDRHGDPDGCSWTTTERSGQIEQCRRLTAQGRTAQDIAHVVGVTPRTVYRWRAQTAA